VNYTKLDDATLLTQISKADENALSTLYDRYGRLVFSLAFNMVGNHATAEEITLDIFNRVWDKAHTYQVNRAKVSTWLASMTRNRAIDILRRESVRPEQKSVSWAEVMTEPVSNTVDPETSVDLSQQKERVRTAVAQLPNEQQRVLALAFFKGYSQSKIAQVCDLPLGTVKTRIRLAMKKLRQTLQDEH